MTKNIYLIRHGETDWNKEGKLQGHVDVPLNSTGIDQSRRLKRLAIKYKIEAVLSSDLTRAVETAVHMIDGLNLPHLKDSRLREMDLGSLQGKSWKEMPLEFRHRPMTDDEVKESGTESTQNVLSRSMAAMEEFLVQHPSYCKIAIVSHGGVIRRVLGNIMGQFPPPTANAAIYPLVAIPSEVSRWTWKVLDHNVLY